MAVTAVVLFLGILGIGAVFVPPVVGIVVAYKAKMVCSGVYVAGGDARAVIADIAIDDLAFLRYVRAAIDSTAETVTATALGVIARTAAHRPGQGCALVDVRQPVDRISGSATARAAPPHGTRELPTASAPAGLDSLLASAFAEPAAGRPRRTRAIVVVHRGAIVAERYADGIGPDTPLPGWSMTKSVMNALAGILVRDARLELDGPAPVPAWHSPGDARADITLDHLLRMSSGLHFDEGMSSPMSDVMLMLFRSHDVAAFAIDRKLDAAPGTRWQYASGTSNIIAQIIRNVLHDDADYLAFPRRALFDPLGMANATLEADAAGTFVGSSFMYATARDWARFGMLYLDDGVWQDRRILPEGWVSYTTTPAPADPDGHYGAHFWLDVPAEYRGAGNSLPGDAFHAAGHEAQFVTVVPSRDVVIVRLGRTRYPEAWDHARFVRDVLAVLDRE